ncbi:AraC family transcriptional regulator [Methylobacterium sp. 285MFTsu5.1]|uniref:AraC family transcriptional regulator n=1 Tax=Methylobacterium sp. 285MFTsu5.1 TaxID=1172187 RepID=UPI0009DBB383|nr:AraC family transcriptional regulator [Methylobacterium sp. 285MFTsu5.1]
MPDFIDPGFDQIESDRDRAQAWVQAVSTIVRPTLTAATPVSRCVRFHSWQLGGLILNEIAAPPQIVERTPFQIASQGVDHVMLSLITAGKASVITSDGEQAIPVGSVSFFDLSQQSQARSWGVSGLNVIIPRRYLDARLGEPSDLHQSIISPSNQPLVRLLSDLIRNTHSCIEQLDTKQKKLLADGIVASLNAVVPPVESSSQAPAPPREIKVRQYIEQNLSRNDLGVDVLCTEFGLSRTPVYEIFEAEGGVMTYIRNRRLSWAMRMLSGLEGSSQKRISEVAYACGYDTLKAFSKAFKARYGVVPRDVDASYVADRGRGPGQALQSWMKAL